MPSCQYAADPEPYHLASDVVKSKQLESSSIQSFPLIEYENVPMERLIDEIIPEDMVGQNVSNLYLSLEQHEKIWLRALIDLRFKLLDECEALLNDGVQPFGFDETNELEYPNIASIARFQS